MLHFTCGCVASCFPCSDGNRVPPSGLSVAHCILHFARPCNNSILIILSSSPGLSEAFFEHEDTLVICSLYLKAPITAEMTTLLRPLILTAPIIQAEPFSFTSNTDITTKANSHASRVPADHVSTCSSRSTSSGSSSLSNQASGNDLLLQTVTSATTMPSHLE